MSDNISTENKHKHKKLIVSTVIIVTAVVLSIIFNPFKSVAEVFAECDRYTAAAYTMRVSLCLDKDFDSLCSICDYLNNTLDGSADDAKKAEMYIKYAEMVFSDKDVEKLKNSNSVIDEYSMRYSQYLVVLYMKGDTEKAKTMCLEEIETSGRSRAVFQFLLYVVLKGSDEDRKWASDTAEKIISEGPYFGTTEDEINDCKDAFKSVVEKYKNDG